MTEYTIGILFSASKTEILLIKKVKPQWQKGKLNFPGGKTEGSESPHECIAREFREETNLNIPADDWIYIGMIQGEEYLVDILTCIHDDEKHGIPVSLTDEEVDWYNTNTTNKYSMISNLRWLIPFALNFWEQGNHDQLKFGTFKYI